MEGLLGTSTTSAYPLTAGIDTLNVFGSNFNGATVSITPKGPGTNTLTTAASTGPHYLFGAAGTVSDGWHTFEFRYDDGCQNATIVQTFCANTAPYLTGVNIDQTLDIDQLYEADASDLFGDYDVTDTLTFSTTAAWPTWM